MYIMDWFRKGHHKGPVKRVQQEKVLANRPNNLSLIHRTHIVERDNQLLQAVLWPPLEHFGSMAHAYPSMCPHSHKIKTWKCSIFLMKGIIKWHVQIQLCLISYFVFSYVRGQEMLICCDLHNHQTLLLTVLFVS